MKRSNKALEEVRQLTCSLIQSVIDAKQVSEQQLSANIGPLKPEDHKRAIHYWTGKKNGLEQILEAIDKRLN